MDASQRHVTLTHEYHFVHTIINGWCALTTVYWNTVNHSQSIPFSRNILWNLAYPVTVNRVRLLKALTVIWWHLRFYRQLGASQVYTILWRHGRLTPPNCNCNCSVSKCFYCLSGAVFLWQLSSVVKMNLAHGTTFLCLDRLNKRSSMYYLDLNAILVER